MAVEGPSLAGKSTLIQALKSRLPRAVDFSCYVDNLASDSVPAVNPGSTTEQVSAFRIFADIELIRVAEAANLQSDSLILLDRSIDTLLAHAYTLDHLHGHDSLRVILDTLNDHNFLVPDLSIYLDTPYPILQSRLPSRSAAFPSELVDPNFLAHFREYFAGSNFRSKQVLFVRPSENSAGALRDIGELVKLVQGDDQV